MGWKTWQPMRAEKKSSAVRLAKVARGASRRASWTSSEP